MQIKNALLLAAADKARAERDAEAARDDADAARREATAGREERERQAGLIDELKDKLSTVRSSVAKHSRRQERPVLSAVPRACTACNGVVPSALAAVAGGLVTWADGQLR